MTSCTMDSQVVQLAFQHEQAVDRHSRIFGAVASVGRSINSISAGLSGRLAVLVVRAHVKWVDDQVVWFLGGAKSLDERDRSHALDPNFTLIKRLHALEARVAGMQATALAGIDKCPSYAQDVFRRLAVAYGELQEAIAEMRGAMQAYEADRCALTTAIAQVESAEALEALLSQLNAEA